MRRTIIAIVAIGALVTCGVAAAAATLNTYSATVTFTGAAGSAKKPAALGYSERYSAKPVSSTFAEPLVDITLTMSNAKLTTKGFATCSAAKINAAKNDTGCPKAALIGTGPVTATLYSPSAPTQGVPCDPVLDVFNAGAGKLTYFFKVPSGHTCPIQTGGAPAWNGTIKQRGSSVVSDTPLPPAVSTDAGNYGLYSALGSQDVVFPKHTAKVGGKTVAFLASTGCKARKYTVTFTASNGSKTESVTQSGSAKC